MAAKSFFGLIFATLAGPAIGIGLFVLLNNLCPLREAEAGGLSILVRGRNVSCAAAMPPLAGIIGAIKAR